MVIEVWKILRGYCEIFYVNIRENLDEIDEFLKIYVILNWFK